MKRKKKTKVKTLAEMVEIIDQDLAEEFGVRAGSADNQQPAGHLQGL